MSTITEIQEAIGRLPAIEKSGLATWLQSQEEPLASRVFGEGAPPSRKKPGKN